MLSLRSCSTLSVILGALAAAPGWSQSPDSANVPHVVFDSLPSGWASQANVMDEIWKPLGARGVNYYSFGARAEPNAFAARSDPSSPLYQAWLGAYVITGALDSASEDDTIAQQRWLVSLATRDQISWLAAMGDPAAAAAAGPLRRGQLTVAGAARACYRGDLRTHSDLSAVGTPLARSIGMPPESTWANRVTAFHDLTLHVTGAVWYDRTRHVTVIVYGASASFRTKDGVLHDEGPVLDHALETAMRSARLAP